MKITGFIWLEEIVEKLEVKHHVSPDEVEELFERSLKVRRMNKGHFQGEDVYRGLGRTNAGRYLAVFFIHKISNQALILSARDMDDKERRSYGK